MSVTIIFGTKRLGQSVAQATSEKYPDQAVITVEGLKGAKKSRRILMNTKAAELLGAEVGEVQEFVFASVEMGENEPNQVLIANRSTIEDDVDVTYKTSKNKVSYGEDSSEKGKAITSSHACNEIFSFLGLDDTSNVEFELNAFEAKELEAFSLDAVGTVVEAPAVVNNEAVADTPVLEANNGEVTGAQLQELVQAEVAKAEELNPIFDTQGDAGESDGADALADAVENEPALEIADAVAPGDWD